MSSELSASDISTEESFMAGSSEDAGVGLSNPQLSKERRRMLDLVNKLHSTGVQVDIDLPQIAVIGSQSAGKSSLIESISGITLPRAAGTCTRCPTEIRLSCDTTKAWQCVVSLRFISDSRGQILGQAVNKPFGATILDKTKVEERIRRAQRAILNPNKSINRFLEGDEEDTLESELSFSSNCVSIQISGPDVADLSFCDLPGLIASVSRGGNEGDIELVERLVTSYIKKPSCIILLTVACETDFENQGAHRLAKEHDPEGKRTVGVLTKPDRIPQGEELNWLPFIRNEKEALENNWFCVKQPNSNDLKQGMTWDQARKSEDRFFSMTPPWSELEALYQKYLRTSNLVTQLSSILSDLISKRLPEIHNELERSIQTARDDLRRLPKEPSNNPMSEITNLIFEFTTDLSRHIEGIPHENGLMQCIRPAHDKFRRAIRDTAPKFRPFERKHANKRTLKRAEFLANEEGYDGMSVEEDSEGDAEMEKDSDMISPSPRQTRNRIIYIDEVFSVALKSRTRELQGNYPFEVQKNYIEDFTKEWKVPAHMLCRSVHSTLAKYVKELVSKHFASFGQGHLEQRVNVLIQSHIKECLQRTLEKIDFLFALENRPFSLNTHYLADYKSKFVSYYKGARKEDQHEGLMKAIKNYKAPIPVPNITPQSPIGVGKVMAGLVEMGMLGAKPEDLAKLFPPDQMDSAIMIMADVRAYFQVAYKRFADNIPLAIDHELVRGVMNDIFEVLCKGLGINGPNGHRVCQELAQENHRISDRRKELQNKLQRLNGASEEIVSIRL